MPTILVKDALGASQEIGKYTPGRTIPADSAPVVMASAAPVNRSGVITAGGTAQQLMAANSIRGGWWLQNLSTADLWVSDVGTAAASQPSLRIAPGVLYESPLGGSPVSALSIFGSTPGQAFSAREF